LTVGSTPSPLADWAFVSLGEQRQPLDGSAPIGEFTILRERFGHVISMTDWIGNVANEQRTKQMGSTLQQLRFAVHAICVILRSRTRLAGVYCSEEFPGFYVAALLCVVRRRIPLVVLVHNVGSNKRRFPLRLRPFRNRITTVLCLSATSQAQLIDELLLRPERVRVIGSRVDETFYAPTDDAISASDPLIVSAGAINRDYETLIAACEQLGVRSFIAAGSAWSHTLGGRTFDLAGDRLTVASAGPVALRQKYWEALAVVVPLHQSGYASGQTVILEAMSCGKTVITSDIRGRSDFIEHGVNGYYVEPGNVAQLTSTLRMLTQDPEKCRAIGREARRSVEDTYSVARYVQRIEEACVSAQERRSRSTRGEVRG
jgi:glycosyltransferase involved in cell wall biosynthesis